MNSLNTKVVKPVLKEIVFIGKTIAYVKSKIINHDPERVIRKANAPFVRDTIIFAINVKLMKVIFDPTLHDLDYVVKCGQRCIGCNP